MSNIYDVAIIGGGPAGMMAGISAKTKTKRVLLLERNNSLGRKLLLTGKGRCNVTTAKTISEIVEAFGAKGKFLYGALSRFSNDDLRLFFETRGVRLKVERGSRVFPVTDRAQTILNCLKTELQKKDCEIFYHARVSQINIKDCLFEIITPAQKILSQKIIIATGGKSYPQTGSTGDGYIFGKIFGHKIIPPQPALAPLIVFNKEINSLAGLSLKNVMVYFLSERKMFAKKFGEMLFTHQGVSGPIILEVSFKVGEQLDKGKKVWLQIDLKPRLDQKTLTARINREIQTAPNKEYQSLLKTLLPRLLIPYAQKITGIDKHQKNATLSKIQKTCLINFLKNFRFPINKVASLQTAIVTYGGIDINEIDSKTMESKIVPNLFFAGEIIALDGPTGGYNLQKAFSTGWVAGESASAS